MPAPVSIVIPTLNAGKSLPRCLEALIEGLGQGLIREVIFSDAGSQDETVTLAEIAGAEVVIGPASRGGQLQRGCAVARGNWLLILHSDTVLQPGWAQLVADHLSDGHPVWFHLEFDVTGKMPRLVAGWANLRARVFGMPYGDQGLLVSRTDYNAAGGYPDQPLMEDVAIARALSGLRGLPIRARTSAERYLREGWIKRGARNLWTLLKFFAGVDPHVLVKGYEPVQPIDEAAGPADIESDNRP